MRFLSQCIAAVGFSLAALTAFASPDKPEAGKDYVVLDQPQPTEAAAGKVEVIEFFGYFCPHCNAFEPKLSDWVKKQGDKIVFKRIPVVFGETLVPQQKLYYALDAMGKAEEMQKKVFRAIHVDRQQLMSDDQIMDFIGKQGIDKAKFAELYASFAVQTKVNRVPQLQQLYKINSVPTIIIAGRYQTSPSMIGASLGNQPEAVLQEGELKVMDALVAQAAAPAPVKKAEAKKKK